MPARTCRSCGESIDGLAPSAKYCKAPACVTSRAKARKRRERVGDVLPILVDPTAYRAGSVLEATLRELEGAGVAGTVEGEVALALARRIDGQADTGSAMASLSRELRVTLAAALRLAESPADPIVDLQRHREERERRAAGG